MRMSCGRVPPRYPLLLLIVAAVAVSMTFPLAARDTTKEPKLPFCWKEMRRIFNKQPTEVDRGFAFGYLETIVQVQWNPKKGEKGIKNEQASLVHRAIVLRPPNWPNPPYFFANGCERGPWGLLIVASDLPPGEMTITDIDYNVAGWNLSLTLPEPIRFQVIPSSAVFIGSFKLEIGPFTPKRGESVGAKGTQQALEEPTAAVLASELAPVFDQPWRSYLEALIPH